jgi:uracil-DNA glycosylase
MELLKTKVLPFIRYYPEANNVFRAFSMPMEDIKVVILGQDPYSNHGQANGFSFAVNKEIAEPPSLKIIKKEVFKGMDNADLNKYITNFREKYPDYNWRTLQHWADQGVFLLNAALTVKAGEANSHADMWRFFTRIVVKSISIGPKPIWMMWGGKAKGFIGYINAYYKWNRDYKGLEYNYILEANHPAAETRPGSEYKFTGCNHFNIANDILGFKKQSKIEW